MVKEYESEAAGRAKFTREEGGGINKQKIDWSLFKFSIVGCYGKLFGLKYWMFSYYNN